MKNRTSLVVALAAYLLAGSAARAQERSAKDLLQAIPGEALGFGIVNDLERIDGKIQKLIAKLKIPAFGPGAPKSLLSLAKLMLNVQKGLDDKGSILAVVIPGDDHPAGVLMIPVTDYKDFIGNFGPKDAGDKISEVTIMGKTFYAGKRGSYAVLDDEDGKESVKKVIGSSTNVAASVKGVEKWLEQHDASAVLTPAGLKMIVSKTREGLEQLKGITGNLPPGFESIGTIVDGIDEFFKNSETEVRHILFGVRVDAGLNLEMAAKAVFTKGGKFSEAGAKAAPPMGGPLAGLPGGPFVVAAGGAFPAAGSGMARFSLDMLKLVAKDVGEAQFKKLEDAYSKTMKGLRGMAFELRVGKAGEPLMHKIVSAINVADAKNYLAGSEQAARAMNDLFKEANIPFYKPVEIKKVKVGDLHALETITDMSDNPGFALIPQPVLELIFGKEAKIIASMTAAGNDRVLARYSPASGLKKMLEASTPGLAEDAGVMKTAALLPKGHQWALYISPKGVADTVKQVKAALEEKSDMPAVPMTPPIGIGIKLSAGGLDGRLVVPVQVVEAAGTLVPHIMRKMKGGDE